MRDSDAKAQREDVGAIADRFRTAATTYVDAQLAIAAPNGVAAATREELIAGALRIAVDAQATPLRRALLRAIRRRRARS